MSDLKFLWTESHGPVKFIAYEDASGNEQIEASVTFQVSRWIAASERETARFSIEEDTQKRLLRDLDTGIDHRIEELHKSIQDTHRLPKPVRIATVKVINWDITESATEVYIELPIIRQDVNDFTCVMPDGKHQVFHRSQIQSIRSRQPTLEETAIELSIDPFYSVHEVVAKAVALAHDEHKPVFFWNRGERVYAFPGDTVSAVLLRKRLAEVTE